MAWETNGVRAVKNAIMIKGQSNFKSTAKDILITSQLRTALILNKKTKARNYTLETVNKNIYIFGIAMDAEEKKEVINYLKSKISEKYLLSLKEIVQEELFSKTPKIVTEISWK